MKTCIKCLKLKPESEFYKDDRRSDGLVSSCRSCKTESSLKWNRDNPGRNYRARLKRVYGLTDEECDSLPDSCQICGSREKLCIDHDHNFGFVRGVLCHNCNFALGLFQHDSELLQRASAYLLQ